MDFFADVFAPMTNSNLIALGAMAMVGVVSAIIGTYGVRVTRSTSDFLVASRRVGPVTNAGAISGEYLSAASFLSIAGVVMREGADGLWAPVSFCAGFLAMQLFVAAPLRRSGAYTVPDFAESRLPSPVLRKVCAAIVIIICTLYILPQLQGAGVVLTTFTAGNDGIGFPHQIGVFAAAVIVLLTVVGGGMRSITLAQAFQFWLKFAALAIPAMIILPMFLSDGRDMTAPTTPTFPLDKEVEFDTTAVLTFQQEIHIVVSGTVDGVERYEGVTFEPGNYTVEAGTSLFFEAGSPVPAVRGRPTTNESWVQPNDGDPNGTDLVSVYSAMLAGFLGPIGLPHLLVRFYTNPDGRAARRTTIVVLAMTGGFYLCVTLLGVMARLYTPQLMVNEAEAAVLLLPTSVLGENWLGWALAGLIGAGAVAAFLATSSGLLISIAGVLSTDVLRGRFQSFRFAAVLALIVPLVLSLQVDTTRLDFGVVVPLVFAVASSTFCPLLVLGIWWRGLTAPGAISGVLVGAVLSLAAVATSQSVRLPPTDVLAILLRSPAGWTVPTAFLTMIVVSLLTRSRIPAGVEMTLLRLHAPERLGLGIDRVERVDRRMTGWS